ncbi:Chromatin assembly factor 1 subunit [Malassezia sp. CBS 17886]|nr:Chromatin assembly factor 1 subunit [Malassezia sp. CBS 17886]
MSASTVAATPHPPRTEYAATLSRHAGVVNVVRFSPTGEILASAGDDGNVLFWVRTDQTRGGDSYFTQSDAGTPYEKETWRVRLMTRATSQELYDLAWSPQGDSVAVGGTDFAVRIVNAADGSVTREIAKHQHYVQGVAWDPLDRFLATQSSDRCVHVYNVLRNQGAPGHAAGAAMPASIADVQLANRNTKLEPARSETVRADAQGTEKAGDEHDAAPMHRTHSRSSSNASARSASPAPLPSIRAPPSPKERLLAQPAQGTQAPHQRLYGDDRYSGFFRRLTFSPDGALLVTPTGQYVSGTGAASPAPQRPCSSSAVYMYARGNLMQSNSPVAVLPGHKTASIAVSFSPILYRLRRGAAHAGSDASPMPTIPLERGAPVDAALPARKGATGAPGAPSAFGLPYRMVFAVATQESVWVYDTQQATPLCCFSNLHYASFTDLSWSPDGQSLVMSSSDGYCSIAVFDYQELGRPLSHDEQPSLHRVPPPALARADDPFSIPVGAASAPRDPPSDTLADDGPLHPRTAPSEPSPAADSSRKTHPPNGPATDRESVGSSPADGDARRKKRRVTLTFVGPLASH